MAKTSEEKNELIAQENERVKGRALTKENNFHILLEFLRSLDFKKIDELS